MSLDKDTVKKLATLANGVFYAPLDFRSVVRRVLSVIRPTRDSNA